MRHEDSATRLDHSRVTIHLRTDAAAMSAIASESQHKTMSAMSHRRAK
jgi:hypothetical protein